MRTRLDFSDLVAERDAALLSLDKEKIMDYARKYQVNSILFKAGNADLFWTSVHKARTGARTLPNEARLESKRWLELRGFKSMDGGDLEGGAS